MSVRWLAACVCFCLGCRGIIKPREQPEPITRMEPVSEARQTAKPEMVAAKFEETPRLPVREDDALSRAAGCIEKGDHAGAAKHFALHLRANPDQVMIRAYLAEVLLKSRDLAGAQHQFECFIAQAQAATGPARSHILHCHTRLLEIALERSDAYHEHLHRGIGMALLARQLETSLAGQEVEPGFRERLLCKAAAELTRARKLRPDEPRPCWYLHEVWGKLGQDRSAAGALSQARKLAALLPLPPVEQKALLASAKLP